MSVIRSNSKKIRIRSGSMNRTRGQKYEQMGFRSPAWDSVASSPHFLEPPGAGNLLTPLLLLLSAKANVI